MEHINDENNDIVADTLSSLAKRSARREYFKRSVFICCLVMTCSIAFGAIAYIKLSPHGYIKLTDAYFTTLPFSYGIKKSLRRILKAYSLCCLPLALQFASGFTLFSPYICLPTLVYTGGSCGAVLSHLAISRINGTADTRLLCSYLLYAVVLAAYCIASVYMACVSMSFCYSVKRNSQTSSRMNDGDVSEYFSFFMNTASASLLLFAVYCIGMYAIALFK